MYRNESGHKHRDINWLYFNERVLLEAENTDVPLLERLKFLAIFSANLDEYFKVRVSQLRQLRKIDKTLRKKLILKANKILRHILEEIHRQQVRFGKVFREILEELKNAGIFMENAESLSREQLTYIQQYFRETLQTDCRITNPEKDIFLEDGQLYLVVDHGVPHWSLVQLPSNIHGRFHEIPGDVHHFIFLDDIVKLNIGVLFPDKPVLNTYAIKLSRDAELYLEDDYSNTALVEKIYHSLEKRESGQPTRLLFDDAMPGELQRALKVRLDIGEVDMFPGGQYHNLSDFFGFDDPTDNPDLKYIPQAPLPHPVLSDTKNIFASISEKDQAVHFPFQQFSVVEKFIEAAAQDPDVVSIKMTLYRIAETSRLTDALIRALRNNKKVTLFVEAKARFDEKNNIAWGQTFIDNGATVFFSVPNIKVHSKVALIDRREDGKIKRYAYIGTGNFNAQTSAIYCDHGLFTKHSGITEDLEQVFSVLQKKLIIPKLRHILASPYNTRNSFLELIEKEIRNFRDNLPSGISIKMNSLEDAGLIEALHRAESAGVPIRLLVRGFCCLVPKEEGNSNKTPIRITSIVDRYLEHGRLYLFENGGDKKLFMGSADWMTRNLDKRIEVLTPILDADVFKELEDILEIQLQDNVKARVVDAGDSNKAVGREAGEENIRSQYAIYKYLKEKLPYENY